ncbi:MAG: hypothetical protein ACRDN0_21145 [Trebonia sp.]
MPYDSRLNRYASFISEEYFDGFLKGDEYFIGGIHQELNRRLLGGHFKRIVFTGMGCSAIVSDVIRGYFIECGISVDIHVVNDYDFQFLVPDSVIQDEATLIVISSYSGNSDEPIMALRRLLPIRHRVLLLTSGGRLAEIGTDEDVSILYWRLQNPDREYPLFHVTQYFAILLDFFKKSGLLDTSHVKQLPRLAEQLRADADEERDRLAARVAAASYGANLVLVATPKWHESLLKLCKMHLNEIAMVPAARNQFHDFCHSEVASLTDPEIRHSVLVFCDAESDDYTKNKIDNLVRLLNEPSPQNRNVSVHRIEMDQPGFLRKFFGALDFIQRLTLLLGRHTNLSSRDLISEAAGNNWYHSSTISGQPHH